MQFTKFRQTGLTVSRMILGTGTFGKQTDEKEAHRMLDKAAEAGINFIDSADVYPPGADVGSAEIVAGRWLSNKRARFILATKGGGKMGPAAWDAGSSRKHLLDAIDASLRRLNTDHVDLYQPHMDDPLARSTNYGHTRWGPGGGTGIGLGTILLILLIAYMLGLFR